MSVYIQNAEKSLESQEVCKYSISFNEEFLNEFLNDIALKYPKEEVIKIESRFSKEEDFKKFVSNFLGATQIVEYYDFDGKVHSEFYSNYKKVKIRRKPIIYDMINRWLKYKKSCDSLSKNNFKDIYLTDLITELENWYEGVGITVAEGYSSLDKTLKSRKLECDEHIKKEDKLHIVKQILLNVSFEQIGCISTDTLHHILTLIKQLDIFSSKSAIAEISKIIKCSKENYEFLKSIGFNPKHIDYKTRNVIVVSNIHGLLANKNLFTGKITHISKFYNNDNDPSKGDIYFEEREITCEIKYFKEATAEDIYAYRENYYFLDGTRPFLNMTVEEIKMYLEENS